MKITRLFAAVAVLAFADAATYADDVLFNALADTVREEAEDKGLPMLSIVLVDEDGIAWSYGVGADTGGTGVVADADTAYRIGSVSKLFTDIVVMQWVERGVLDLDAPVSDYLPDFAPANPFGETITLRRLMSHSSGLVREPPVGNYFVDDAPSLAATVASLNDTTLVYTPGSKVQYSNAGIAVVGRVLEVVGGRPFAEVLDEAVLRPLGMQASAFVPTPVATAQLPRAWMWSYHGDREVAPTFELGMSPAGSMYSTMNELALFIGALIDRGDGRDGRILSEASLDTMWSPQSDIASARNRSFGIGFGLSEFDGEFAVSHGGAIYGFATQLKVLPDAKVGVAVSTNLDMANGTVNRIGDYALRVLLASKRGEDAPTFGATAPVADELADRLVGLYQSDDATLRVLRRGGELYVERVNGLSLRLRELDGSLVFDDQMSYDEDVSLWDGGVEVHGVRYRKTRGPRPAPANSAWKVYLGEYGWDHNVLYISERDGHLHALIEWGMEYPLEEIADGTFRFPAYGLYPNEDLDFMSDADGRVRAVSLNGIEFVRRPIGDVGDVFKIVPQRPVAELEREALAAEPPREDGEFREADLVDVTTVSDTIRLDIRYNTERNFLGTPVYSSARAFLQRPAAEALGRISARLADQGYGLLVHDAYRPWYVTKIFWDATPEESKHFVADPSLGSRHNRGAAIDLTLYDLESGEPIDMVGLYDEFSPRSYPHYPGGTSLQRWHRQLLIDAMEADGFTVYEYEWWHFDFDGWERYRILTDTFESLQGP